MNNPKVSIIIATYNSEATLRAALESVLYQKFQDWECIVVDGASKDNTIAIVKEYETIDPRFKHISEKDNGIYDAFNKGWKMAKGEWVHYLGSDDYLTQNSFSELTQESFEGYDVVSGNCYILHIDGSIATAISSGFNGCHQGKLTRRSAIEKMGGFDESYRILADKELYLRLEATGAKAKNIDSFVAYFRMDGTSQKISNLIARTKERIRVYKPYKKNYRTFVLGLFVQDIISTLRRRIINKTKN